MIGYQKRLVEFLLSHGLSADESANIMRLINQECPWFGGPEEVSEEIGVEILADVLPPKVASLVTASTLIAWHNRNARSQGEFAIKAANSAYTSLVQTVTRFGVEEGLGSGDFWVMEDSFSRFQGTVVVFKPLPLPEAFRAALTEWLNGQDAMKKLTFVDREGDALFEIVRK
jgi:hypothetical protein